MKDAILLELAARWELDALPPKVEDGSPGAQETNAIEHGIRQGKRECADGIRTLVKLLS